MGVIEPQRVNVELGADEALVLFDWLSRQDKRPNGAFEDQSEQRVLWDLIAGLEAQVPVLDDRYADLLADARDRVRDTAH